ncbi:serine/threonine-protein kinase [Streptacidiphilus melanogenes]|uniref:serine/threonine-protein kinase n=1 Tax=Streptacidiphilus melanogenes TaxID=411235 RepID=UPI000693F4D5|nr:serine/threonine-protein kinase [Streptacidiphilus melanogenes]
MLNGSVLDGRYQLDSVLGAGGMGEVWRATDSRIGRPVAVKVIRTAQDLDETAVGRFTREARLVGSLSSPHIVTLHDFGEAQVAGAALLYLVMELLEGTPLGAGGGPVEPARVLGWAVQICEGLQVAHEAGIVHRDLKPANVLLTSTGTVKLLDFGIAKLAEESTAGLTGTGGLIGTPAYMSPEQARGDTVDARSDLYSLGCLLYGLLAGQPPFPGTGWSVLRRHVIEPAPSLRALGAHLPVALTGIVDELLRKEPDARPPSAAAVADRLRALALVHAQSAPREVQSAAGAGSYGAGVRVRPGAGIPVVIPEMPPRVPANGPAPVAAAGQPVAPVQRRAGGDAPGSRTPAGPSGVRSLIFAGGMSGSVATQLIAVAGWGSLWAWLVAAPLGLVLSLLFWLDGSSDRSSAADGREPLPDFLDETSVVGFVLTMAVVLASSGVLLFVSPVPWWGVLLFCMLGAPVLMWITHPVRRMARAVGRSSIADANNAAVAGMLVATLWTGLSTGLLHFPALLALLTALALWVAWATIAVLITTRPGLGSLRPYHGRH